MEVTDNLYNSTQRLLTPDFVNKFSTSLNLSTETIREALRAIIPSFLNGLVKKGSSEVGAQSLINISRNQEADLHSLPNNLNDSYYLDTGHNVLDGIFGRELSSVTYSISEEIGINTKKVSTIMTMIAPIVMGVLKYKIQNEGLSAYGLVRFLKEQRPVLRDYSPEARSSKITNYKRAVHEINSKLVNERSKTSFGLTLTLAIVFGSFFLWWKGVDNQGASSAIQMQEAIEDTSNETAEIKNLKKFLDEGSLSELPKSFVFKNLNFALGTNKLKSGSLSEIQDIGEVLRDYPRVRVRIEGFTDNTGNAIFNIKLSEDRANKIKAELVKQGIHSDRLEAYGLGQQRPLFSNNTEVGRARNRRIEFIITEL